MIPSLQFLNPPLPRIWTRNALWKVLPRYVRMNMNGMHTITNLKRWSCHDKQLPRVDDIKYIHVYDFDNTGKLC